MTARPGRTLPHAQGQAPSPPLPLAPSALPRFPKGSPRDTTTSHFLKAPRRRRLLSPASGLASRPRRVCTRPPSRGATSTEPQGLSALCDSESGDPGAGDESHWRGPAERNAWLRGGPGGGGSFKAGPSWSAGGRGGAARGTAMQRSPVCSPGLTAIYENRGKLGRQPPVPRADSPSPA